jgi:hypothetical protein
MVKLKSILTLIICALNSASCVTSGSGSEATAIAGTLVVFSHLVSSAQNGDASAKKAWCEAFALVNSELTANPSSDGAQDSAMTEKLIPEMHNIMRSHGYQLHRQQIGMVIKDGINVSRNEAAKKETIETCATNRST